ncbi:MAG: hdfR 3 [Firmicutes bacterium]|nr:hdfR 3 [Bacillota bacterium]
MVLALPNYVISGGLMELWQLREFTLLAQHLNFTETAKHLFLTQSVLTRHIAALEQELGMPLFIRNKRFVQLTENGRLLLEEARLLIQTHEEVIKKIRLHASGHIGQIRIGYLSAASQQFLVPFSTYFNSNYPGVELHLYAYEYIPTLMTALQRNEIDICITLSLATSETSSLNWKTVYQDSTAAVMHTSHPLAGEASIDAKILADQPFVLLSRKTTPQGFNQSLRICKTRGFTPNIISEIPNTLSLLLNMEMDVGVTFLPRHTKIFASPLVRYVNLIGEDCLFDVVFAWKKSNSNPVVTTFLNQFEEYKSTASTNLLSPA